MFCRVPFHSGSKNRPTLRDLDLNTLSQSFDILLNSGEPAKWISGSESPTASKNIGYKFVSRYGRGIPAFGWIQGTRYQLAGSIRVT